MPDNYTLVCSKQDLASNTISNCLIEKYGFSEMQEQKDDKSIAHFIQSGFCS